MRIFFILLLTLILVSVPAFFLLFTPEVLSSEEEVSEEVALEPQAMNIVVFMTTDQRWDSIGNNQVNVDINTQFGRNVMPNVQNRL